MKKGIYESVINQDLEKKIREAEEDNLVVKKAELKNADSGKLLTSYVRDRVEKAMGDKKLKDQIKLVNDILSAIDSTEEQRINDEAPKELLSVAPKIKGHYTRPETSIAFSSLFTGSSGPSMQEEMNKEIQSSDSIDFLVSFIKWSGLRILLPALEKAVNRGVKLRIITTSYMGATDIKAIETLASLPNTEIRISYDTKRTRLHAKTYIFKRNTGFTTAYVGSSNMSSAALSSGLEWNLKIAKKELPDTMDQIEKTFETYWSQKEFEIYTEKDADRLRKALNSERHHDNEELFYAFDIQPYSYQKEILENIKAERDVHGHDRNLVVAATGTGKTIIAALDYRDWRKTHKRSNLLFIAHREEILKQSIAAFRAVLKDNDFASLIVGDRDSDDLSHLFISIQSVHAKHLLENEEVTPDYYDFIIIDEFHHAAADSYQDVLNYFKPKALLGLTATPERMDGLDVLKYFDGRIASELRLTDAINRKLLCPFQYFGIADDTDLSKVKWTRGGYDEKELSDLFTFSHKYASKRASLVINSTLQYVDDINEVRALGFCVSQQHAEFMAESFTERGIPAMALTSKSSKEERESAEEKLVNKDIHVIFTVDIYNEGVDIPEVNTVLFLRPTKSLTIFLQQLGRGLRLCEGKDVLTVLDFIGQANQKYTFEDKFRALLTDKTRDVEKEIKNNFSALPAGCYIQLQKKAQEYILKNIRDALKQQNAIKEKIKYFEEDTAKKLTLTNFLNAYPEAKKSIYKTTTFSTLKKELGLIPWTDEDFEKKVQKGIYKLSIADSRRFITFLIDVLDNPEREWSAIEKPMLDMLDYTMFEDDIAAENAPEYAVREIKKRGYLRDELTELLEWQYDHIDFVDRPSGLSYPCPLDVYCTYSRNQILTALGYENKPGTMRQGVTYIKHNKTDVFLVTLNKNDTDYSPSTMYNDYALDEDFFHWQSQSTTNEDCPTGQRYIHHKEMGSNVLLFVRENKKSQDTGMAENYTFLGKCTFVKSEGSSPMNIIWKLENPIPAKLIGKANRMIIG